MEIYQPLDVKALSNLLKYRLNWSSYQEVEFIQLFERESKMLLLH